MTLWQANSTSAGAAIAVAMAAFMVCAGPLAAQPSAQEEQRRQQQLDAVHLQLEQTKDRQAGLERELTIIRREAEELSNELIGLAGQIQARESRITETEKRIVNLGEEEAVFQADLVQRRRALSHLLAGLQKLERNPPPPIATRPDDAVEAVRGAMLFATIVPELRAQSAALAQALARIDNLRISIRREQQELRAHLDRLTRDQAQLQGLHRRKLALAETTDTSLIRERERNAALAKSANSLKSLLDTLERNRLAREAERRRLEKEESQRLEEEQRRIEALKARPRLILSKSRGKLAYPAQGLKVGDFGEDDGYGGKHRGLSIATRRNAQVISPVDGRIEFAGPFRSYGKLLILNANEGYHVLIAGLEDLGVQAGQHVRAGEPVGTMGAQAARGTLIGAQIELAKPILYVEFRRNGKAIDPTPWWVGNRKEARR